MEEGLIKNTGKPLAEWIEIVKNSGKEKHKEILDFLKSEHGFTHRFANFVSLKARESDAGSFDEQDLITNQYKGKESLKPIYDKILEEISSFGDDMEIAPKKDSVSLRRKKQFALVKPATKSRIDLGLKLKGKEIGERLEGSGPFGSMCTHRVRLESVKDVNSELISWLKEAYEKAV
jgi:predicted transport protein